MKIIIYGATEFGYLIANEFCQKYDVIVIDKETNKTDDFDKLDISFVNGSGIDVSVLKPLNIKNSIAVSILWMPRKDWLSGLNPMKGRQDTQRSINISVK